MEKNKKPQIRFKGFTDDWEQRRFEEIFNYERPDKYIVKSDKYEDNELTPVLTANKAFILGYTSEKNTYHKTDASIIFDDFTLDSKYVDFPYMVKSSAIKILTLKDMKKDNLRFNYQLLNITKFNMMGHARHYISVVQPTPIMSTNKEEQDKISNLIKNIDNLITLHQRKYDKLRNIKASLLGKMFPKDNKKVPEIRFKGFTDTWEQRKFEDFGKVVMCKRIFKEQTKEIGDVPFYKIGTFGEKADAFIDYQLFEEYKNKYPYPKKGAILISASGSIGKIVEYQGKREYFQDSNIVWLEHDSSIKNKFLKYIYQVVKWEGLEGSTIQRLYNSNILKTKILLPEVSEQAKIANFFESIDNLITLHQSKLEKLKKLKQALLNKMFI